ncbi:MAG: sugar phosphate isomerase/epimerase [Eubacteriales bacterium]|nr:sugar phosphate isomerase/epimerase [Eubacteriales bacterium]
MKVGYMTNAWGAVTGHPGGVTSIKDLFYLSTGEDEQAIKAISEAGFEYIEIFDGNLMAYETDKQKLTKVLQKYGVKLFAVYTGADFIYDDVLEEEFYKMERATEVAGALGAKHLCIGGGAVRSTGIKDVDYRKLANGLDRAMDMAAKYGLIASYHPHLGTCVQTTDQLDKLMPLTKISLCPDCGHIAAGGGDPVEVVRKYNDRIKYLHLKDHKGGGFYPLGMGDIDFKEIIRILYGKGVDYTVEADGYTGSPEEAAKVSFQYLSGLL